MPTCVRCGEELLADLLCPTCALGTQVAGGPLSGSDGTNVTAYPLGPSSNLYPITLTDGISIGSEAMPFGGQDGDVLVRRNGRAVWMSPEEAFQLRVRTPDGIPLTRRSIEREWVIASRREEAQQVVVKPTSPVDTLSPSRRTAWTRLLEDEDAQ